MADRGLCVKGQKVLDLGTGTGVLPRNMYKFGAEWTGTDISPEQIEQAKKLSEEAGMNIDYQTVSAEKLDFPDESFDVITACQCFWYFDHEKVAPEFSRILKKDGDRRNERGSGKKIQPHLVRRRRDSAPDLHT